MSLVWAWMPKYPTYPWGLFSGYTWWDNCHVFFSCWFGDGDLPTKWHALRLACLGCFPASSTSYIRSSIFLITIHPNFWEHSRERKYEASSYCVLSLILISTPILTLLSISDNGCFPQTIPANFYFSRQIFLFSMCVLLPFYLALLGLCDFRIRFTFILPYELLV